MKEFDLPLVHEETFGSQKLYSVEKVHSPTKLKPLFPAIHQCMESAFGKKIDVDDAEQHMLSDHMLLVTEGENVLGFSSSVIDSPKNIFDDDTLPDDSGTYFAAAVVAKESQGKGIYRKMNESRISYALKQKTSILFTRTQNPLVETGITHTLQNRDDIVSFSLERYYMPNCYGGMLSEERPPTSPDGAIQREHDKLNLEAGDAYVLVYSLDYQLPTHTP